MNEQAIDIVIKAKDEATKAVQKVTRNLWNMRDSLNKVWQVSAVAFWTLSYYVYKWKQAIDEDAEATNRLTKLMKTAVWATDAQVDALIAQADALEKTTVAWKDAIMTTQSQLATFNLSTETIQKLTPAILDYVIAEKWANASSEEFRQMTNGLAQALNGNFASLTRSWFVLDEHTKKLIKNGTEAQKAEAIAKVLWSTYKWFAEDATKTAIGRQIQLNKAQEDFSKLVASAVIPIMEEYKLKLYEITIAFLKWSEEHPELIKNLTLVIATLAWLWTALLTITPIIAWVSTAVSVVTMVVKWLWVALTFLSANPIALVIWALVALWAWLYLVYKNWDQVKTNLILVWRQIKEDLSAIISWLKDYIIEIFTSIWVYVEEKINFLKEKARQAAQFLQDILRAYEESKVWQVLAKPWEIIGDMVYWTRATGWSVKAWEPYLVGERWPEIVIPKSASTVIPNGKMWSGVNVSINFGGVSVRNDGDITEIARQVENALTRKMQLYRQGVA